MSEIADTQKNRKRETRRDRIAYIISIGVGDDLASHEIADAVIAAYPEPHERKERGQPKSPDDHCQLHAMRHEFASLCRLVQHTKSVKLDYPGAAGLAHALIDQGVVGE